jgi:hypothetical protein
MKQWIKDTAGLGTGLWLFGYLVFIKITLFPGF